ncbi:MAG: hypothetical protein O2931_11750 [Planctomycetota bacterium]|nr:hypothetical protein [Planctomycetota bacterium]
MPLGWPSRFFGGLGVISLCAALILLAGFVGFQQIFSTFALYDDEGYVMISLCRYMQGRPLYDDVFTQYGPAYYVLQAMLNDALGLLVTHDGTRLKSLVLWLGVSCGAASCVRQMTQSWTTTFLAFCLVFCHLDKLCLEPGHPQEWVALCVIGVVMAAGCLDRPGITWRRVGLASLGMLLAVALLTKLNIGVFLALSVSIVLLRPRTVRNFYRVALPSLVGLVALLPFALFRRNLTDMSVLTLPVVTACAALALYRQKTCQLSPIASTGRPTELPHRVCFASGQEAEFRADVPWLWISLISVVAAMLTLVHLQGTSWSGLWRGIVAQHWTFGQRFFHSPGLLPWAMFWSVAIYCWQLIPSERRSNGISPSQKNVLSALAVFLLFATIIAQFWETSVPLVHGLQPRGQVRLLMSLVPSLLVLLVIPRSTYKSSSPLAREMLAWVGLLQPLSVFPTPGTQSAVGTIGLLMACVVIVHDSLVQKWEAGRVVASDEAVPTNSMSTPFAYSRRFAGGLLWAGSLSILLWRGVWLTKYRQGLVALDLPGCHLLAMDRDLVEQYRWLVATLQEHADTFVFAEHGHNSLYFWTQMPPPTSLNVTFWPFLLRPEEQSRIVSALKAKQRVCVVHEEFGAELPDGPLRSYIEGEEFQSKWSNRTYQISVRGIDATHDSQTRSDGD